MTDKAGLVPIIKNIKGIIAADIANIVLFLSLPAKIRIIIKPAILPTL